MKLKLIELIKKSPNTYARYLERSQPDIFKWISIFPGSSIPEKCYNAVNDIEIEKIRLCQECEKPINSFISFKLGYRLYCSSSCSSKSNIKKNGSGFMSASGKIKRSETLMKRYGTTSMISVNRSKSIASNMLRLGVEYPLQSEHIRKKVKENLLTNHGVNNISELPEVIEKIKNTLLTNHGVTSPLKSPEIFNRYKESMMTRYGVETALANPDILKKVKNTNLLKYGHENVMQSPDVAEKSSIKQKQREIDLGIYEARINRFKELYSVEPLFSKDDYLKKQPLKWKHVCGNIYESNWNNGNLSICPRPECVSQSSPQRSIYEYIKSIIPDSEILVNIRSIISPYELDIYIPEKNIAIEVDGIYWHQFDHEKTANKKQLCEAKGISLLHITDIAWESKSEIWKSILSSKLKTQSKIFARKCELKSVDFNEASIFLDKNHLQGSVNHSKAYGLYLNDELQALMTFGKPRFNKNFNCELLRYSSKLETTVVGGASRLLKAFISKFPGNIVTYAKKEYSNGNLYKTLGFKLTDSGKPSYFYIKGDKILSRYQAQKHKLSKLLGEKFNELLTERENMIKAGYIMVTDRGSFTYSLD